jgi:ssDNA-binding Zn-finger/Zn-ribbon topoisomerase 1
MAAQASSQPAGDQVQDAGHLLPPSAEDDQLRLAKAPSQPAMHLLHGWWIASCPDCGYEFAQSRSQKRTERAAAGQRCPVCGTTMDQVP